MVRSTSIFLEAACAALATLIAFWPTDGRAQSCCAGAAAVAPGRLLIHERALAGAEVRAGSFVGSYQGDGTFVAPAASTSEVDLEQDLFTAVQMARRFQVGVVVPLVQTRRATRALREWGGGLGDLRVSARYDVTRAGESLYWPGLAVLAGVTAPTGVPVDRADQALATDATGAGAWQGTLGVALEQTFGPWFAAATALITGRLPRQVGDLESRLGPRATLIGQGALSINDHVAIALTASFQREGDASVDGHPQRGSGSRVWTLGCAGSWAPSDILRVHAGVAITPPWSGFGANAPSTGTFYAGAVRAW